MLKSIHSGVVKVIRSSGQALDALGKSIEVNPYVEKLQPSTKLVKYGKSIPQVDSAFVASSATVVGKVQIAKGASIWHGAVIRGDDSSISVGADTTIGTRCMLHSSNHPRDLPTIIGKGAVIDDGAILHGAIIEDGAYIGAGAQVMDGAKVCKGAIVMAGAVVSGGKTVPPGKVWAGVPATEQRDVTAAETQKIAALAKENKELSMQYALEEAKTWQTIELEEYDFQQSNGRSDYYYRRLSPEHLSKRLGEVENHQHPGRVLDSPVSTRSHPESRPQT